MLSGASETTLHTIFPVQCCPILRQHRTRFFLCNVIWSLPDNLPEGSDLWDVVPKVLRQHRTGIFPVQCCLEPLEHFCIGFWHVQCCPKSFQTTLNKTFPVQCCLEPLEQHCIWFFLCKGVPGVLRQHCTASRTTLHRILTCVMS